MSRRCDSGARAGCSPPLGCRRRGRAARPGVLAPGRRGAGRSPSRRARRPRRPSAPPAARAPAGSRVRRAARASSARAWARGRAAGSPRGGSRRARARARAPRAARRRAHRSRRARAHGSTAPAAARSRRRARPRLPRSAAAKALVLASEVVERLCGEARKGDRRRWSTCCTRRRDRRLGRLARVLLRVVRRQPALGAQRDADVGGARLGAVRRGDVAIAEVAAEIAAREGARSRSTSDGTIAAMGPSTLTYCTAPARSARTG